MRAAESWLRHPPIWALCRHLLPWEPEVVSVRCEPEGIDLEDLQSKIGQGSQKARFLYVLPTFQNPTGRTMDDPRRADLVQAAAEYGLPLVEDNPYGDLWYDQPPPKPLSRP
jgi:2-aminoadipate transaminase